MTAIYKVVDDTDAMEIPEHLVGSLGHFVGTLAVFPYVRADAQRGAAGAGFGGLTLPLLRMEHLSESWQQLIEKAHAHAMERQDTTETESV